jgi:carbon starvation protein CstA
LVTIVPLSFAGTTTLVAGWKNITDNFLPMTPNPALAFQGYLDATLTAIIMFCAVIVLANSILRWYQVLSGKRSISTELAPAVD